MIGFMDYTIRNYPDEKIFFSNCYNAPLQFPKIGKSRFKIMVKKDSKVTFHDRSQKLKEIFPDIIYYNNLEELYKKAKPGCCNAVFFGDRFKWMEFIHF
jgi:hypothetical protein